MAFPADFPRGNQRLGGGDRVGWGFALNRLDATGKGVVLWSLGDPTGQHFEGFRPIASVPRRNMPTEHLYWSLDGQGNGFAIQQQSDSGVGVETTFQAVHIFEVVNYVPQAERELKPDQSVLSLNTDKQGNGWLLLKQTPPAGTRPSATSALELPLRAYPIRQYRLESEPQTLPASLPSGKFVVDAQGSGLVNWIRYEPADNAKPFSHESLWIQTLDHFSPVGEAQKLADNAGPSLLQQEDGTGMLAWLTRDDKNMNISYELLALSNYAPGKRLNPVTLTPATGDKRLEAIYLSGAGDGALVWSDSYRAPGSFAAPETQLSIQAVQAYQPALAKRVPTPPATSLSGIRLQAQAAGRGLLVWEQLPRQYENEFLPNKGGQLMAMPLETFAAAQDPVLLNEPSQASVDAYSLGLTPEGHGLVAWTQFDQRCEQIGCSLNQTIWARAVYGYRIP